MKLLFTCGGTAGHINPAVALARLFQARHKGCQVLFVGAKGGMETKLVPQEGWKLETVSITNLRRSLTPKNVAHNIKTVFNMGRSRRQAGDILDSFQPDLVIGTGGYASYPVVMAAAKRGIPTAVHESNALPGLTTKTLAKVVSRVMVGFEESVKYYENPGKVVVTGTPVRGEFFSYSKKEAREKLGILDEKPLLVSFFGSLGAEVMNGYMSGLFQLEAQAGYPYHHIHGAGRSYEAMRKTVPKGEGLDLRQYIYDMPLVMAAADLVICRAGASTIAELTAIARPSILIPSPNVTADHQTKNAQVLSEAGGAVLLPEGDCSGEFLWKTASDLLESAIQRDKMSRILRSLAKGDAAEQIYETLMGLLEKEEN